MPYFSICIPQYNRTRFLLEALQSIADQSFRDFELCISDGGSTDGGRPDIENALKQLGVPYEDIQVQDAVKDLEAQAKGIQAQLATEKIKIGADKEIIALIAYLQRLGTDISKK